MSSLGAHRGASRTALVLVQIIIFVTYIFGPAFTSATDPTAEPTPTASAPETTQEPAPSAEPEPTEAPAEPDPTPMPTSDPEPTAAPSDAPAPDATTTPDPSPEPDLSANTRPYIVSFAAGTSNARQLEILAEVAATDESSIPQLSMRSILLHGTDPAAQVSALNGYAEVARVEADRTRESGATPSDAAFADQWSLPQIGWTDLYGVAAPGGSTVVAVLDTGVDASHPDLDAVVLSGTSVLDGSDGLADPNGHGTAMAGLVAAETNNGFGIAGAAWAGVSILPVTVLGADGLGQDSDIIAGVVYAADAGADVILMSFSNPGYSPALQAAIDYAWASGAVLVAAAGNDGVSTNTFPAGDRGVIGVASTGTDDALATSSNYGESVFLAAPGVDMPTTSVGGGVSAVSGTSASAALVAGAAAQLRALDPSASNGAIVGRLARNADPTLSDGTGNGRVNLARAAGDISTDSVQPAGAAPVGDGGPLVGPYAADAVHSGTLDIRASATPCATLKTSFAAGEEVCARAQVEIQGSGNNRVRVQWFNMAAPVPQGTTPDYQKDYINLVGHQVIDDKFTPLTSGAWSVILCNGTDSQTCAQGRTLATAGFTVAAGPTNVAPPVAAGNASVDVNEGQTAANSGSWSDANAGDTVTLSASIGTVTKSGTNTGGTWSWSFGTTDGPAEGQTVTITANDGTTTSSTTFALTVANVAPAATFTAPASVVEGSAIDLSLADPSDPSSTDTAAGFEYRFDCGDGTGYGDWGTDATASCATTDNGSRAVAGQIRDKDGGSTEYGDSVTITNANPLVTAAADQAASEGSSSSFELGSFTDAGVDDGPWSVSVDWGDGSTDSSFSASTQGSLGNASHTYADNTTPPTDGYTVTVTVTDKDGGSHSDTFVVSVANLAPSASNPTFSHDPVSGLAEATFDFTDPGWLDIHSVDFTWTVNGVTVASEDTLTEEWDEPDSTGTATSAVDLAPGCNTITITGTVDDNDGGMDTITIVQTMSVDVYLATFDAPIKQNERNIAKYGNVVPVKVRLVSSCTGAATNTPDLFITVAKGSAMDTFGTEEIPTVSVSAADSDNQMLRTAGPKYMYNLSTKGFANTKYEIRIRAHSISGPIIARAVLSPK